MNNPPVVGGANPAYAQQPQQQQQYHQQPGGFGQSQPQYAQAQNVGGGQNPYQQQSTMQQYEQAMKATPQKVVAKLDELNENYFKEMNSSCQNLIDIKAAVHQHEKKVDDAIQDMSLRHGRLDGNIDILTKENAQIQQFLASQSQVQEINSANVG